MKYIRKLIGWITLPVDAVACEDGSVWLPCNGIPSWVKSGVDILDYSNPYTYQKLEQGFFGHWKRVYSWRGCNSEIKRTVKKG